MIFNFNFSEIILYKIFILQLDYLYQLVINKFIVFKDTIKIEYKENKTLLSIVKLGIIQ